MWNLLIPLKMSSTGKRKRREKRVPPSAVDKAMAKLEGGGTEVSLVRTPVEMGMDENSC